MDWGKVIYVFFILMSLTTTAGFIYEDNAIALFIATSVNLVSTILKIGVRNLLAAEMFASSLVADLHLIPAFVYFYFFKDINISIGLAIGAIIANVFSMILVFIESSKLRENY